MENKILMPELVAMLALATGKQKELCENFLKELFSLIADELEKGESVRIKGFGNFKLVEVEPRKSVNVATGASHEIAGHYKITFIAAKELANMVNRPFEAFEAVEVADDLTTDELLESEIEKNEDVSNPDIEEVAVPNDVAESSPDPNLVDSVEVPVTDEVSSVDDNPSVVDKESSLGDEETEATAEEGENAPEALFEDKSVVENVEEAIPEKKHKFFWGFIIGFFVACLVSVIGWFVMMPYIKSEITEKAILRTEESVVSTDILADTIGGLTKEKSVSDSIGSSKDSDMVEDAVPTQPSDAIVYDTISNTRYLTTMAKEHYGNFNLWPIIYKENEAILGHPDRIKPGTRVVVPALSKYGIDPKNAADVKKVKQAGIDIYSRYK